MAWRAASVGEVLGRLIALKEAQFNSSTTTRPAFGVLRSIARDDVAIEAGKRLGVAGEGAIGGGDKNMAQFVVVAGAHLHDARVICAGRAIGAHNQFQFGGDTRIGVGGGNRVEACLWRLPKPGDALLGRSIGDQGRRARGAHEPFSGEVIGVGIACAVSGDNANTTACAHALAGGFDQRLIHRDGGRGDGLKIEIRKISAG